MERNTERGARRVCMKMSLTLWLISSRKSTADGIILLFKASTRLGEHFDQRDQALGLRVAHTPVQPC